MRWFEKLAGYIEKRGGKRQLFRAGPDGKPVLYMERYYLVKSPICEIMLHNFHQGDRPDLHDHPWASGGVILAEGYREHTPKGVAEKRGANVVPGGAATGDRWPDHPGCNQGSGLYRGRVGGGGLSAAGVFLRLVVGTLFEKDIPETDEVFFDPLP